MIRVPNVHPFARNIRRLSLKPDVQTLTLLIKYHTKDLIQIQFWFADFNCKFPKECDVENFQEIWQNIEYAHFKRVCNNITVYHCILKSLRRIKQLSFRSTFALFELLMLSRSFPTLEYLHWSPTDQQNTQHFEAFFRQNPNVRVFSTGPDTINGMFDILLEHGICIDELHLKLGFFENPMEELEVMHSKLNTLHQWPI